MKSFQSILQNICFSTEVYDNLNSKLSNDTTTEEFVQIVRTVDDCFNGCSDCGCDLEEYDYDYMTSHGVCYECSMKEDEL